MGEGEQTVFRTLLIIGAGLWLFGTFYTTLPFVEEFIRSHRKLLSVPFAAVSMMWGITHVVVAVLYVAATYWDTNIPLLRVTLYAIPTSTILWALFYIFLGYSVRRDINDR